MDARSYERRQRTRREEGREGHGDRPRGDPVQGSGSQGDQEREGDRWPEREPDDARELRVAHAHAVGAHERRDAEERRGGSTREHVLRVGEQQRDRRGSGDDVRDPPLAEIHDDRGGKGGEQDDDGHALP